MFSNRTLSWALAMGFMASTSGHALAQTFTQPSYDFGLVSTFATVTAPTASPFSKQLTFSLNSAADIRIDARMLAVGYKYDGATSRLSNPVFNLFDSTHTLVGTSAIDASFAQTDGNDCTFTQCFFNQGVTLAKTLSAGSYSIEFSSYVLGTRPNTLHFGVSKNEASVLATYLAQVTPAGAVPETSTWAMMALGLLALGAGARKNRQKA